MRQTANKLPLSYNLLDRQSCGDFVVGFYKDFFQRACFGMNKIEAERGF